MAYETIDFKADGAVARITLNRPDRLNSFTAAMHEELRDALGNLGEARVVVLTAVTRSIRRIRRAPAVCDQPSRYHLPKRTTTAHGSTSISRTFSGPSR